MKILGDNSASTMRSTLELTMGEGVDCSPTAGVDNETNRFIRSELRQRVWREALMAGALWCPSADRFPTWFSTSGVSNPNQEID